jgi:hypothetical protein
MPTGIRRVQDVDGVSGGVRFVQMILLISAVVSFFQFLNYGTTIGGIFSVLLGLFFIYLALTLTKKVSSVYLALIYFILESLMNLLMISGGFFNIMLIPDVLCVYLLAKAPLPKKKQTADENADYKGVIEDAIIKVEGEEDAEAKEIIDEAIGEVEAEDNKGK